MKNYFLKIPVGPTLDAEVCRRVFGMPEWRVSILKTLRLLPKYSTNWGAAMKITWRFYGMHQDSARLALYNEWMSSLGALNSRKGVVGAMVIGGCPSNVCDAALFAEAGMVQTAQ